MGRIPGPKALAVKSGIPDDCKLWEYVASGKPVVITSYRDFDKKLQQIITAVDNYEDFINAIHYYVKGFSFKREENIRLARKNI